MNAYNDNCWNNHSDNVFNSLFAGEIRTMRRENLIESQFNFKAVNSRQLIRLQSKSD